MEHHDPKRGHQTPSPPHTRQTKIHNFPPPFIPLLGPLRWTSLPPVPPTSSPRQETSSPHFLTFPYQASTSQQVQRKLSYPPCGCSSTFSQRKLTQPCVWSRQSRAVIFNTHPEEPSHKRKQKATTCTLLNEHFSSLTYLNLKAKSAATKKWR